MPLSSAQRLSCCRYCVVLALHLLMQQFDRVKTHFGGLVDACLDGQFQAVQKPPERVGRDSDALAPPVGPAGVAADVSWAEAVAAVPGPGCDAGQAAVTSV